MKVCVTGGGGFLGLAIVRQLLARGDQVISYSRSPHPQLAVLGVEHQQGSLADLTRLTAALKGAEAVIHVAAKAGLWGSYQDFYSTNVQGTENIIKACLSQQIRRLVYTSTPSVIYQGHGIAGADESLPYPNQFDAFYPQTKALAEQMIRHANSPELATVSLRPHIIWGPGDPHFIPRLVARARAGRLRLIGDGQALVDHVYVEDAARAHLLALDRLDLGSVIAGKVYFITQDQPLPVAVLLNHFLTAAGVPPVQKKLPYGLAYLLGGGFESFFRLLNKTEEPPMTRFLAKQLATPHWFNIQAAKSDLGYIPQTPLESGLKALKDWCLAENYQAPASFSPAMRKISGKI